MKLNIIKKYYNIHDWTAYTLQNVYTFWDHICLFISIISKQYNGFAILIFQIINLSSHANYIIIIMQMCSTLWNSRCTQTVENSLWRVGDNERGIEWVEFRNFLDLQNLFYRNSQLMDHSREVKIHNILTYD